MSYKTGIVKDIADINYQTGSSLIAIKKNMQNALPADKKWANFVYLATLKAGVAKGFTEFKKKLATAEEKVAAPEEKNAPKKVTPNKKAAPRKKAAPKKKVVKKKKNAAKKSGKEVTKFFSKKKSSKKKSSKKTLKK